MSTKKEIADRILTTLRQTNKDRFLSKRFVLNIAQEKMKFLLSQKLRDRSLYRESNIYTNINCVEFEEIDTVECDIIEFRMCKSIMKSKGKLPDIIYSRYGDSIRMVTNLDHTIKIGKTTPTDVIRNKHRKGYVEEPYYYIRDGYLYLINTHLKRGFVELLTLDTKAAEELECGCNKEECKPALEYEFVGSDKLMEAVIQQTLQELSNSYLQIRPDENPNNNENVI